MNHEGLDTGSAGGKQGPFAAFRYRNYRFLWGSGLGAAVAFWMELVVIGWLVLELTGSSTLVGLVGACRYAGMVLGPFFGAIADRFDRRRILLMVRAAGSLYAITLATLYYTSLLQIWHIFVLVLWGSVVMGFNMTTASTLTPDTVERHNLASAVGMLMVGMSVTSIIGPLMGGYLYDYVGVGGCFVVMAGSYLLAALLLLPMRLRPKERAAATESVAKSVARSLRYVAGNRALSALMVYAAIANLFIFPSMMDLMAVFARNVLHVGASELGWLIAAQGVGRLIGALIISTLGQFRYKGWLLVVLMVVWPVLMGIFSLSRALYVALPLIAFTGIGHGVAMALIHLFILMWASEEFRGRVMGVRMFVVIFEMMGSIIAGALANRWGMALVIMINAISCTSASIITAIWAPELRRRQ
jgi:MFS family permease